MCGALGPAAPPSCVRRGVGSRAHEGPGSSERGVISSEQIGVETRHRGQPSGDGPSGKSRFAVAHPDHPAIASLMGQNRRCRPKPPRPVLLDHREERLEIEGDRPQAVGPQPPGHELEIAVDERMTEEISVLPSGRLGADKAGEGCHSCTFPGWLGFPRNALRITRVLSDQGHPADGIRTPRSPWPCQQKEVGARRAGRRPPRVTCVTKASSESSGIGGRGAVRLGGRGPEQDHGNDQRPDRGNQEGDATDRPSQGHDPEDDRHPGQPARQPATAGAGDAGCRARSCESRRQPAPRHPCSGR